MKYTVARLAFVATAAAIVGVFLALVVYFTLIAALIFLVLATVITVAIKINARKRAQGRLESARMTPVQRLTGPGARAHTNPAHDEDQK
jgi:hypothetical membrane protein